MIPKEKQLSNRHHLSPISAPIATLCAVNLQNSKGSLPQRLYKLQIDEDSSKVNDLYTVSLSANLE